MALEHCEDGFRLVLSPPNGTPQLLPDSRSWHSDGERNTTTKIHGQTLDSNPPPGVI